MKWFCRGSIKGFTLIELMISVTILAIIAFIGTALLYGVL